MIKYSALFYAYVEASSLRSARGVVSRIKQFLQPKSVLDVGCGTGAWLSVWQENGVQQIRGVDGRHVDRRRLLISETAFTESDLSHPFDLGDRFDLVMSLEVAEHLSQDAASDFIHSLGRHGDIILFSAAVVGQGGTHHVNERPLEYWRELFAKEGFAAYDAVRPLISDGANIEPWYVFNTILYANENGARSLPEEFVRRRIGEGERLRDGGTLAWMLRRRGLSLLPKPIVNALALLNMIRVAAFQTRRW